MQRGPRLGRATNSNPAGLPLLLLFGLAAAAIGGPIALVSLYTPNAVGPAIGSTGLAALIGVAAFTAPIFIWWRYSQRVGAAGGLYSFVEAATGPRAARAFGLVWILSYFLYLPYTITDIVYDQLPVVAPGITPYRASLELALPVLFVLAVLLVSARALLVAFLASALAQLVLLAVLGAVQIHSLGWPFGSFLPHGGGVPLAKGAGNLSLLFVCGSLVLFFGGEARGGGPAIGKALVGGFGIVSLLFVFAAFPLSRAGAGTLSGEIPGHTLAGAYSGGALAAAVGWGSIVSTAGLILAEFLALGRVLLAMLGTPLRSGYALLGIGFVGLDAISLLDPQRFYDDALNPSLIALYVAQLAVFASYPLFRRRAGRFGPLDLAATGVAGALAVWGIVSVVQNNLVS